MADNTWLPALGLRFTANCPPRATKAEAGVAAPGPAIVTKTVTCSGPPELELEEELLVELELLPVELDELELLLEKIPLLDELLEEELLDDDELLELLDEDVGLTPPLLLSPESFELHAASNNAHINADKILGTAFLQAILLAGACPKLDIVIADMLRLSGSGIRAEQIICCIYHVYQRRDLRRQNCSDPAAIGYAPAAGFDERNFSTAKR